jgi:hypothetical protein
MVVSSPFFPYFQEAMWKDITDKETRLRVKPGLAWTEIVSYIKGSAEAVRSPTGRQVAAAGAAQWR